MLPVIEIFVFQCQNQYQSLPELVQLWGVIELYQLVTSSTKNLIVPRYDYATGTRLISISDRKHFTTISDFVFTLYDRFIITSEQDYPGLKRMGGWEVLFTALLQVVTVKQGLEFLMDLQEEFQKKPIKQKKTEKKNGNKCESRTVYS